MTPQTQAEQKARELHTGIIGDYGTKSKDEKRIKELTTLIQKASERDEYRGLLYGCAKHQMWNGMDCVGCLKEKADALDWLEKNGEVMSDSFIWMPEHDKESLLSAIQQAQKEQ